MKKTIDIKDFYDMMTEKEMKVINHNTECNVFMLDNFVGEDADPIPFNRKRYYKLLLIKGKNRYNYADKSIEVNGSTLFIANPMVPYSWEPLEEKQSGVFCVFTSEFINPIFNAQDYPLFQLDTLPIFELNIDETKKIEAIFDLMLAELKSEYEYKYDVLRSYVFQLLHKGIKLNPVKQTAVRKVSSKERITSFFLELLERQFPMESISDKILIKNPSEFANSLSVHVNYLNKVLKEVTGQSTSALIANRVLQEAKMLLKHSDWNINEIGYCLGFEEPTNFISFFKRHENTTPHKFRIEE